MWNLHEKSLRALHRLSDLGCWFLFYGSGFVSFTQYTTCLSADVIAPIDSAPCSDASSHSIVIVVSVRSIIRMMACRCSYGVYW